MIKCLGIWCGSQVESVMNRNFEEKIKNLKTTLNIWSQRKLSLKGKVAVLRSMALPQVLYVTSVLYTPEWVVQNIEKLFLEFLWSKRKAHVSKDIIIKEITEGGLKMPLFGGMLRGIKCTWIRRILNSNSNKMDLLSHFIKYKNLDVKTIIQSKLDLMHVQVHSIVYRQILGFWYDCYATEPTNGQAAAEFPLWHNKFIVYDKKPCINKVWNEHGICRIMDIINQNGQICSKKEIENKHNVAVKQMDYNSIIHAIPKRWIALFKENNYDVKDSYPTTLVIKNKTMPLEEIKCKDFYWHYI